MAAGLPGVGIGALFFIVSALLMPVFELARTLAGRGSVARWRFVGRQGAIALGIVVAIVGSMWCVGAVAASQGPGAQQWDPPAAGSFLGVLLLLGVILGSAGVLRLIFGRTAAARSLSHPAGDEGSPTARLPVPIRRTVEPAKDVASGE